MIAVFYNNSQPEVYAARVDLVDEHKESMDLSVGLTSMSVAYRDLKPIQEGFENDPFMYTSVLESTQFLEKLQETYLDKYKLTYKEYLKKNKKEPWWSQLSKEDSNYAVETLKESITCKVKGKYYTIIIQFIDNDRDVAALMCKKICDLLAENVRDVKARKSQIFVDEIKKLKDATFKEYQKASQKYAEACDSNFDIQSASIISDIEYLKDIKEKKQALFNKLEIIYFRATALQNKELRPFTVLKDVFVSKDKYQPTPIITFLAILTIMMLLIFMFVCFIGKRRIKSKIDFGNLVSPWSITILIWALIMFLMQFRNPELLVPLTGQFYYAIMLWIPIFCIFSIAMYNLLPSKQIIDQAAHPVSNNYKEYHYSKLAFNVLFAFSIICTPILAYKVYSIVSMFGTEDLLYNVRVLAVFGNESMGFLNYTHVVNQALLVIAIWHYPKIPLWKVLLLCLVNVMSAVAIMEKGTLFFLAVAIFFVLYEKRVIKLRGIIIAGLCVFALMYLFNIARSSEATVSSEDETTAFDFFLAMYILSPCQAFETEVVDLTSQTGIHTFDTVYLFMQRFGVPGIEVPPKIQDFVYLPVLTNVYTVMQPFFIDFGYKGVAFFAMIYGAVSGWVYRSYRNGSNVARCVYVFFVYALVLQFYQEYILSGIVPFLQFIFFTVLICQNKIALKWTSQ